MNGERTAKFAVNDRGNSATDTGMEEREKMWGCMNFNKGGKKGLLRSERCRQEKRNLPRHETVCRRGETEELRMFG